MKVSWRFPGQSDEDSLNRERIEGKQGTSHRRRTDTGRPTGPGQQVLRGPNGRLRGPIGEQPPSLAAPGVRGEFSSPPAPLPPSPLRRASSRVLRHGVAMHPKGRLLREGTVLLSHATGPPFEPQQRRQQFNDVTTPFAPGDAARIIAKPVGDADGDDRAAPGAHG